MSVFHKKYTAQLYKILHRAWASESAREAIVCMNKVFGRGVLVARIQNTHLVEIDLGIGKVLPSSASIFIKPTEEEQFVYIYTRTDDQYSGYFGTLLEAETPESLFYLVDDALYHLESYLNFLDEPCCKTVIRYSCYEWGRERPGWVSNITRDMPVMEYCPYCGHKLPSMPMKKEYVGGTRFDRLYI